MQKLINKRTVNSYDILLISIPDLAVAVNTTATAVQYEPKRLKITTRIR